MEHQEGFFKGCGDVRHYYQGWFPERESKAILVIVHGLAEHSGRYRNLVNYFVPLGYAVYGMDHLGHGQSDGPRVYVKQFEDFTKTLKIYLDLVRKWHPDKPIFLVGHSMGGLIGALFLLDHQADLTGAVLSGPAVKISDQIPAAIIFLGRILAALMPRLGLVGLEPHGISRDPAVVEAYIADPLVYTGKTTARLAAEMVKAMGQVTTEADKITLPILIVQGGADKLVNPAGAQMLYDLVKSVDKKIIIYDGFYHEVFNEPEHDRVLGDVEIWLEGRIPGGASEAFSVLQQEG